MFVIILKYLVDLEVMDSYRGPHLEYLDEYYKRGLLLASGRKDTGDGGVIMGIFQSEGEVDDFIRSDPFYQKGIAEYQVHQFSPTKYNEVLKDLL